ncbi:hypothetical protein [Chryseobacterium sp.]|uniref:hypothetical protein n=1 Tax=Chryseobacterium sp. TaxID=1871047 RepID=UPI002FC908A0
MQISNFNKLVLLFGALFLSYILYGVLSKNQIEPNSTTKISGNYNLIKRDRKNSRVYYNSYTIILKNNPKVLRIIPEYKNCFNYKEFVQEIKPDAKIEIEVDKQDKRLFSDIYSVVQITSNSKNYINTNCVNKSIQKNKIKVPLIMFGLISFLLLIVFIQKKLGIKIN